ncbi:MAG: sugar kinase [Meiothermus sp.]
MIAALDIGGTKLSAASVQGGRVLRRDQRPTPEDRRPQSLVGAAVGLLEPFLSGAKALGVAATGTVRGGKVTAPNQQTLPWTNVDLQGMLQQATHLPTFVLNDADAACWGEARFGVGRGVANFLFVTVSTGIGSGLVLGGRLHEGSELGFTRVSGRGFLEHLASGKALDEWAEKRGWDGAAAVVKRAESDAEAAAVLEESARLLADKLLDLQRMLGLERVAVGGSLGLSEGYIRRLIHAVGPELAVVSASLGADAGLIGAADWANRQLDAQMADTNVG